MWNLQFHGQFESLKTQGFGARARLAYPTGSRFLQILAHRALMVPTLGNCSSLTSPIAATPPEANQPYQAASPYKSANRTRKSLVAL